MRRKDPAGSYTVCWAVFWLYAVLSKKHTVVSSLPEDLKPRTFLWETTPAFMTSRMLSERFTRSGSALLSRASIFISRARPGNAIGRGDSEKSVSAGHKHDPRLFHVLRRGGVVGIYRRDRYPLTALRAITGSPSRSLFKRPASRSSGYGREGPISAILHGRTVPGGPSGEYSQPAADERAGARASVDGIMERIARALPR
jgi:hypothetical protein